MIIKNRDSFKEDIQQLKELLSLRLSEKQRFLIERELRFLQSGEKGEQDSVYYLNFHLGKSNNWAVIHDLRLSFEGQVAQIDHVVINRQFQIFVLETKNYAYGIKIMPDGEFLVSHNNKYYAVESPIEQNERHIALLKKVIEGNELMPKRLGIAIRPSFISYVLVSPTSRVIRPAKGAFNTGMVIKSDQAFEKLMKEADDSVGLAALAKLSSSDTVMITAYKLSKLHAPVKIDYRKKFGIADHKTVEEAAPDKPAVIKQDTTGEKNYYCSKCRKTITLKVAQYCWDRKKIFGGKAYCFDCQKEFAGTNK